MAKDRELFGNRCINEVNVDTILLPTEEEVQQRLDATAGGNEGDE
jgi:hypothetical protein